MSDLGTENNAHSFVVGDHKIETSLPHVEAPQIEVPGLGLIANFAIERTNQNAPPTHLDAGLATAKGIIDLRNRPDNTQIIHPNTQEVGLPLNVGDRAPHIRIDGDSVHPATPGETGAVAIDKIEMRKGDKAVCVLKDGTKRDVPLNTLVAAQSIRIFDDMKAEAIPLTDEQTSEMNNALLENGLIPTDKMAAGITLRGMPELPIDATPEQADKHAKDTQVALDYNKNAQELIDSLKNHAAVTEKDLQQFMGLSLPDLQAQSQQLASDLEQKIAQAAQLPQGTEAANIVNAKIKEINTKKAELDTMIAIQSDPKKMAELFTLTRDAEVAKTMADAIEKGDTEQIMETMKDAMLAKAKDDEAKNAALEKYKALRAKAGEWIGMGGGVAALLIIAMIMEGANNAQ